MHGISIKLYQFEIKKINKNFTWALFWAKILASTGNQQNFKFDKTN